MKVYQLMISINFSSGEHNEDINKFIRLNSNSLIYNDYRYINLIAEHLSANFHWIVAKIGDDIAGALPFMSKQGPMGCVYNSMAYYGSNGGIIQIDDNINVKEMLLDKFYELGEKNKISCATIITNPLEKDQDFYEKNINYDYKDVRIGQITNLTSLPNNDDFINFFENPRPRNIRRAIREGISIEKSREGWALDFLYKVHSIEMIAKGGLAKKKEFFNTLSNFLNDNQWNIYIGKLNEKPIAALLLLYNNETVEYFTPAIINDYRNTQASSLIIYNAMRDAIKNGFKNWNWGGTWISQDGVYNFKKKWNAQDFPYYYYVKLYNNDLLNKSNDYLKEKYYGFYTVPFSELYEN
tara:strand:- start:3610 stop:4668 length:1059 start_codon:yes stop_codon:yes gene_type:complete